MTRKELAGLLAQHSPFVFQPTITDEIHLTFREDFTVSTRETCSGYKLKLVDKIWLLDDDEKILPADWEIALTCDESPIVIKSNRGQAQSKSPFTLIPLKSFIRDQKAEL